MTGRLFADQKIRCIQISKNGPIVQGESEHETIPSEFRGMISIWAFSRLYRGTLIPSIRRSERRSEE